MTGEARSGLHKGEGNLLPSGGTCPSEEHREFLLTGNRKTAETRVGWIWWCRPSTAFSMKQEIRSSAEAKEGILEGRRRYGIVL